MKTEMAELVQTWKGEAETTKKVLANLTDTSLGTSIIDGHRTLGRMAWHITTTLPEMCQGLGVTLPKPFDISAPVPVSAGEISKAYNDLADTIIEKVESSWDDTMLAKEVELYNFKLTRRQWIDIVIRHEVHHRGQMTVLMRQAGLVVPSLYGPAKEGWAEMGQEPPQI